jgi:hypothetical protein
MLAAVVAGVVEDRCGCCHECARAEGELCDETPDAYTYGRCGENLVCRRRTDTPHVSHHR